jgi:acyl dehydratase
VSGPVAPGGAAAGDRLPPLRFPVTFTTLAMDVSGTRDLYPVHHDPDAAARAGARGIFLNTMWYQGLVGRYVGEWAGPASFLRRLRLTMGYPGCPGDVLQVRGTVTAVQESDRDGSAVDLEILVDNGEVVGAVRALATVELWPALSDPTG